ncbi:MAG: sigma-70 family RNA polymerase sigma factor [Steroidobacteraceae bacterium]
MSRTDYYLSMSVSRSASGEEAAAAEAPAGRQDHLYRTAVQQFGPALARLAAGYEADATHREDLLQDIHLAVWQSFALFKGECALRTWVYRVAHGTAATHVLRQKRVRRSQWVSVEELDGMSDIFDAERSADSSTILEKLEMALHKLKTVDRDILLLYLEGFEAGEIAEVIGISPNLVAQKVHRTKQFLMRHIQSGEGHVR